MLLRMFARSLRILRYEVSYLNRFDFFLDTEAGRFL